MFMPDWTCPTCGRFTILGGDISQSSYDKQQQRIAEHTGHHADQLDEHDGDHEALRFRLRHPSAHAAVQKAAREVTHD